MPAITFLLALAAAAGVEVHLAPDPTSVHCLKSGWVIARTDDGQSMVRVPLREEQRAYRMQLSRGPVWEITAEADGCWSETAHAASDGGALTLALHRAAEVGSLFETDEETPPDGDLTGFVFPQRTGGAGHSLGVAGLSTPCRLDFPRWQCSVPAGVPLDLRLEVPGFGAVHYFGVNAAEDVPNELPVQPLLAGATLSGWIEDRERVAVPGAKLTIYPMQAHTHSGETEGLAARRQVTRANAQGFFHFAGLQPGLYRVVSEADGFSPVNLPEVRVREGESLVWPRPVIQPPVARLEVLLSPPLDPGGSPWVVELQEKAPLHVGPAAPLQKKASADGRWEAGRLRADTYWLKVRDRNGATLERLPVDLSDGGLKTIAMDVRSIAVRGILLLGGAPVSGYLNFTNYSGKDVEARAANDGEFDAVFPATGAWTPILEYPRQGDSRIFLEPVNIDPGRDRSELLELRVPGSRIRGRVLGPQKTPVGGVIVHLLDGRHSRLVADTRTGNDGWFELVAIAANSYRIQADGNRMATARAVPLELNEDETKELTLVLSPKRRVEAIILTPFGTPASGASVSISPFGDDKTWFSPPADASGRFGFSVAGDVGDVALVIATYAWPSAAVRVPADTRGPVTIRLLPEGGFLRVLNARLAIIRTADVTAPFGTFKIPPPHTRRDDPALMAPGTYVVCPDYNVPDDACRSITITPGLEQTVDFAPEDEQKERTGS